MKSVNVFKNLYDHFAGIRYLIGIKRHAMTIAAPVPFRPESMVIRKI